MSHIITFLLLVLIVEVFSHATTTTTPAPVIPSDVTSSSSSSSELDITDYYWREYTGVIPSDAIPGGIDKSGRRTFIGQVYSKPHGLLPATIYPGSKNALASAGGKSFTEENFVKILCSPNQDRYRWVPTKNEETHLLTDCHLVIGGTELGYVLNVARVNHEMETIIGKVFAHHTPNRGMSIPYKDKEARYMTYEILTYNCNLNTLCSNTTYYVY